MKLTIIDTPGFGDSINNMDWWVKPARAIKFFGLLALFIEWSARGPYL